MAAFFCDRCEAKDGRHLVYRGIDESGEIACTEVRSGSDDPFCGHAEAVFAGLVYRYERIREVVTDPITHERCFGRCRRDDGGDDGRA